MLFGAATWPPPMPRGEVYAAPSVATSAERRSVRDADATTWDGRRVDGCGPGTWDDLDGPACAHWTNVHDRIALAAREDAVGVGSRRAAVAMAATAGAEIPGTGIMRRYKAAQSRTWREGGSQWLPPQPGLRWW